MKIVINESYGGFGLSKFVERELRLTGHEDQDSIEFRSNPSLVELVERDSIATSGKYAKLKVIEIPDGIEVIIEEYDGNEWVAEKHRTWN